MKKIKISGGHVFQYADDLKDKEHKHDWYFEFAGCECGPVYSRANARKALEVFKEDYVKLLKRYNGACVSENIYYCVAD